MINCLSSKPLTRWWWFSNKIEKEEILRELTWIKSNGFGGVEIAWVYQDARLPKGNIPFLSKSWSELVLYAANESKRLGLICDFTLGTLWPFGGSFVNKEDSSQTYEGPSSQRLTKSWEAPYLKKHSRVLNHLDKDALKKYANKIIGSLPSAISNLDSILYENESIRTPALFCDSWEVDTNELWVKGFGERFVNEFKYEIEPVMKCLDDYPKERYDYRKLLGKYIIEEFFEPFTKIAHISGYISRIQAHGAPVDLIEAYSLCDIPESEALLFDPEFSYFAHSAAVTKGIKTVSCESFTCLYGWVSAPFIPPYIKQERIEDLKLLADALVGCGVNQIIWHGMPYNPKNSNTSFYATVHVGSDSSFVKELPSFNNYLDELCTYMKQGTSYTDMAVYMPLEDVRMVNKLPEELYRPSAEYHWEFHYTRWSSECEGYHPHWISAYSLKESEVIYVSGNSNPQIKIGSAVFRALYVDVEWLDYENLKKILQLADAGALIFLWSKPKEPGKRIHKNYAKFIDKLIASPSVISENPDIEAVITPTIKSLDGNPLPLYRFRLDENILYCYFAHPKAKGLSYPLPYGFGITAKFETRDVMVRINHKGHNYKIPLTLNFNPNSSCLYKIYLDTLEYIVDWIELSFVC